MSTKPADIPQDVYDTARRRYFDHVNAQGQITPAPTEDELIEVAARCILAERERCATFVETMAVARGYAGGGVRGPEFVRRKFPSGNSLQIARALRRGDA